MQDSVTRPHMKCDCNVYYHSFQNYLSEWSASGTMPHSGCANSRQNYKVVHQLVYFSEISGWSLAGSCMSVSEDACMQAYASPSCSYLCWSHLKVTMLTEVGADAAAAVGAPPCPAPALRTASRNFPSCASTSSYVCPSTIKISAISSVSSWQE
jgi:hypothetical protein